MKTACLPPSTECRIFERTQCFPVPRPGETGRGGGPQDPVGTGAGLEPNNRPVGAGAGRLPNNRPVGAGNGREPNHRRDREPNNRPIDSPWGDRTAASEELAQEAFSPEMASQLAEQLSALAQTFGQEQISEEPQYVEVTIQPWGTGQNDCLWNVLKGLGYSDQEIVDGNLVEEVAELNGIEDPDLVHAGQVVKVPAREESGETEAGDAAGESSEASESAESAETEDGLQSKVMSRADRVAHEINSSGGYRFDGTNDCYGFVRRTWDPILQEMGLPPLPVDDGPSSPDWAPINWDELKPGDVLSTAQGHQWGANWHGGMYAGKDENGNPIIYDCSVSQNCAYRRIDPGLFQFYYKPAHELL